MDVIVNLAARGLRERSAGRRAIAAAAAHAGARLHETRDLADLDRAAREVAAHGPAAVVLAGGDGSLMRGLTALARAYGGTPLPPIAVAPGGTMCTIARNHGMHGDARVWTERAVRAACAAARGDGAAIVRRAAPTLRLRSEDDGPDAGERIGFIFAAGLAVRFFAAYDATARPGALAAARLVARVFSGSLVGTPFARAVLEPIPCALAVDGVAHPVRAWNLILASAVRDVGLHLLVAYRAGERLDRFHAVASGLPPRALAAQLPRAMAGKPLRGEPRIDALVRSLRVTFDAQPSGSYVLDGDRLRAKTVTIEPGPVLDLIGSIA